MPNIHGGYQPDTKSPSSRRADYDLLRRIADLERRTYILENGEVKVDIVGLTVTVSIVSGPASVTLRVEWGDGTAHTNMPLDAWGEGSVSHTYAAAGTYHAQLIRPPNTVVREADITVTGP